MSTNPVDGNHNTPNYGAPARGAGARGAKGLGDFNAFMKILASELQNQDPTDPVKNTEYIAQLAQVESLSQLQNLNNMIMTNGAYDLIGKSVTYQTTDAAGNPTTATGTAQAVIMKGNEPYLLVNGGLVKVSDVVMVAPVPNKEQPKVG